MSNFELGERVRINADKPPISNFNGKVGRVSDSYSQKRDLKVRFDDRYEPLDVFNTQIESV